MTSIWEWVIARGVSLAGSAAILAACSSGTPSEGDVQRTSSNEGAPAAEIEKPSKTQMELLAERRAASPKALLDALGDVTLPDRTKAGALAVEDERAAIADRFNDLKRTLGKGNVAPEEAKAMEAEAEELGNRLGGLTEGQAQAGVAERESLQPDVALAGERAPVTAAPLTPERLKKVEALQQEISPKDETRAAEYAARKAEIFK